MQKFYPEFSGFAAVIAAIGFSALGLASASAPAAVTATPAFSVTPLTSPARPNTLANPSGKTTATQDAPIELALKYVSYANDQDQPTASGDEVRRSVSRINEIYSSCNVRFALEEYVEVNPSTLGLPYGLSGMDDLDPARTRFDEPNRIVVINTGNWNHTAMGPANAWTAMPGSTPSGTVLEGRIANYPEIIAHELGHYLGLEHFSDIANLMNPVIYKSSTALSPTQCSSIRRVASTSRALARRTAPSMLASQ